MKCFLAIVACGAECLAYAVIGAFLGWKRGGGIIPMLILFSLVGWTWRSITKKSAPTSATPTENPSEASAEDEK